MSSDYKHAIAYAAARFPSASIVLYGHSLGGAIAVCLSARLNTTEFPTVQGLILENPFASIPGMVHALYPQRWLPYHYLGRFAFDKWDTLHALRTAPAGSVLHQLASRMLVLVSEHDEVVPPAMGHALLDASMERVPARAADGGALRHLVVIRNALHESAWQERRWRVAIGEYVTELRRMDA